VHLSDLSLHQQQYLFCRLKSHSSVVCDISLLVFVLCEKNGILPNLIKTDFKAPLF
jgi:hypothetical protein